MNFRTKYNNKWKKGGVLDITPLVDIVFQLLIFFLLTATFIRNPKIDIQLPTASKEVIELPKKEFIIGITRDGRIYIEGKETSLESLNDMLKNLYKHNPETLILIHADKRTLHGKVVQIMDLIRKIGFQKIGIAVEPESNP